MKGTVIKLRIFQLTHSKKKLKDSISISVGSLPKIEGNTYSLLETEQLIKNQQEASGHSKEEAVMILNHKKALDYIGSNKNEFQNVSVSKIENIHSLIVDSLNVTKNLRKSLVGITGTNFKPLDNEYQIKEAFGKNLSVS